MKIIHLEGGLGNQMLAYCEYLAMKKSNPNDIVCIENVVYDIPECHKVIKQWNGYELEKIFGIKAPNLRDYLSEEQWIIFKREITKSEFWLDNWNYPIAVTNALKRVGILVKNQTGDFGQRKSILVPGQKNIYQKCRTLFGETTIGDWLKRKSIEHNIDAIMKRKDYRSKTFNETSEDLFSGQFLAFSYFNNDIYKIERDIFDSFVFPELDERNKKFSGILKKCNSVFIHARRGDMLGANGYCYKSSYFKKATKMIKNNVSNPVFVFFCDSNSSIWCRENINIFGLDLDKDSIKFVDWNNGEDSYKDMQLMSCCKHGIITNSSFGWWGAFFIANPDKITISPLRALCLNTKIKL